VPPWTENPANTLNAVFTAVAQSGMPMANPALDVEAFGFEQGDDGHWTGVLITPWAINLLRLPGTAQPWPESPPGEAFVWSFPSGDYPFFPAAQATVGAYHFCSLFSPAFEFDSQTLARQTAHAVLVALFKPPIKAVQAPPPASEPVSRRAFLRLD
jgi:[NiFe] hydrogenase assembly HybE family chaperone